MYIIAVGTPFDGLSLFGPFDRPEEATAWAEENHDGVAWELVDVQDPE